MFLLNHTAPGAEVTVHLGPGRVDVLAADAPVADPLRLPPYGAAVLRDIG